MDKIKASNSIPKSEYWDLITSTLSSYEVKDISSDGTVKRRLVQNDYFLTNDVWNVNVIGQIPNFQEQFNKYKGTNKNIKFSIENHTIGLELKFVLYHKLFHDVPSFSSFFTTTKTNLNVLVKFLNEKHSHLYSLLDLDIEKTEKEWIWWLNNKGLKTITTTKNIIYGEYKNKTANANFFRSVHEKLFNLTDTREEWDKDRWDVRVLSEKYGISYSVSRAHYYLNFLNIENFTFKKYLKKYIKTRLLGGGNFSWGTAILYLEHVPKFLNFINEIEPEWNDLKHLTRSHIEQYLKFLHYYSNNNLQKQKNNNPSSYIGRT